MKHPDEVTQVLEDIEMALRKGNIDFKQADAARAAALAVSYRLAPKMDAALAACAEMRAVLTEIREWRRAAVGLVPQPKTDAETLGARIDAALLSRPDLGRGWASPEDTAQMVGALQMVQSDGEFDSLHEVTRKFVVDVLALLGDEKGGVK